MERPHDLQSLLDASALAIRAATEGPGALAAEAVIRRRTESSGKAGTSNLWLPVCDRISQALTLVDEPRREFTLAFSAIGHKPRWTRRISVDPADVLFWNGQANAVVLGPADIEERGGIWIGGSTAPPL